MEIKDLKNKLYKANNRIEILEKELYTFIERRNRTRAYKQIYYYNRKEINRSLRIIDKYIKESNLILAEEWLNQLIVHFSNKTGGRKYVLDQVRIRRDQIKSLSSKKKRKRRNKNGTR